MPVTFIAAIGSTGALTVLWVAFAVLLGLAWWAKPPTWLKPVVAFSLTVVLAAAVVVTVDAAGVKIDDLIAVLNQLGIKSPNAGGPSA